MLSGISGTDLRGGEVTDQQVQQVIEAWRNSAGIPLYLNYAPYLRTSQLRALVAEAVRKHNVGVVVVDHFREFDLDRRLRNPVDEDEEKAKFLKRVAQELNVAMIVLAHTRKPDPSSGGRPRLADLRGSGQIAAAADFIGFVFRPWLYASQNDRDDGRVTPSDAEMIWSK